MELFESISAWHYFVLAVLLLGLEALGAAGFLLGAAASALLMSLLLFIAPELHWHFHMSIFGVLAVVLSILYYKYFRTVNDETDAPLLNDRIKQYIGRSYELSEAIKNGAGKVQIGDTYWKATSDHDIAEGKTVKIIGVDGMTLVVEAI